MFIVLPTLYSKFTLKTNQAGLVYTTQPLHISRRTLPIIHYTLKNEHLILALFIIILFYYNKPESPLSSFVNAVRIFLLQSTPYGFMNKTSLQ